MTFVETDLLTGEQKEEFVRLLGEALQPGPTPDGDFTWTCRHDDNAARRILDQMGLPTARVEAFLTLCADNGGHCDCEIMFNVVRDETLRSHPHRHPAAFEVKVCFSGPPLATWSGCAKA